MAKNVIYRGSGRNTLRPHVYEIENRGKTYRLVQDQAEEVPNEVADKLAQLPDQKFDIEALEGGDD